MATPKQLEPWQLDDANRLAALFKQRAGISQAAFGAQHEIGNQSMVWQYLAGRRPLNISAASKFAKGLQVSIEEFSPTLAQQITNASAHSVAPSIDDEFVIVRRIDVKVSAGRGQVAYSEDAKHGLSFRADFLKSVGAGAENTVSIRIDGRSMEPTLPDGADALLNLKAKDIVNGKIYAFRCDGELSVKRLFETQDGSVIARSDNPEFEDARITDRCADFEVIGRAFWMGVKL